MLNSGSGPLIELTHPASYVFAWKFPHFYCQRQSIVQRSAAKQWPTSQSSRQWTEQRQTTRWQWGKDGKGRCWSSSGRVDHTWWFLEIGDPKSSFIDHWILVLNQPSLGFPISRNRPFVDGGIINMHTTVKHYVENDDSSKRNYGDTIN